MGHGQPPRPRTVPRLNNKPGLIAVADETVGPAMRRGPGDRLLQRLQGQLLRVHGGDARPAHDPPDEHVGDECGIREAPVGHAHVGDVATCGRFGAPASNLRSIRSGLPSVPFAGLVATGVFPRLTPRMPSPRMMFITWSRPTSAGSQPCANNWAWTFLYPYTAMRKSEWISRMSRAKASWRATSGLAAGS